MELSAKTGHNVIEAFKTMVVEIYRRQNKKGGNLGNGPKFGE